MYAVNNTEWEIAR